MKNYLLIIFLSIIIMNGATCGNQGAMNQNNQRYINELLQKNRFFLRYSLYYGDFYGNTNVCLLSPRRFNETIYLEGIDGKPILPGKEVGIIPFNTEILIEKIEFPPANRPLLTPRYYPWVYLRVDKLSGYKECIVVIRPDVSNPEEFLSLFNEFFSKENFDEYLKSINSDLRDAIFNKKFLEGIKEEEIKIIFGKPDSISYKMENDEKITIYDYTFFKVYFKNGKSIKLEETGGRK